MNNKFEIFPETTALYPATCFGCRKHEKDVMLTIYDGKTFHDVFLTQQQFESLKTSINSFKQEQKHD